MRSFEEAAGAAGVGGAGTGGVAPALAAFARVASGIERAADLDELLHAVAREAVALVGVARCSVHLREEQASLFRGCVGHSGDQDIDAYVKRTLAGMPADGMTLELLRTREPVIVADARTDPRLIRSTVRFWGLRSMMAVPMLHGGEVIGIIHLDDVDRPHAFSEAEAGVAAAFAQLAAVAIVQAQSRFALQAESEAALRQVDALRRAARIDERLSAVMLAGGGLREVVAALAQLLGKPCALYDRRHTRLAEAAPEGGAGAMLPRLLEPPCTGAAEVRDALAAGEPGRPFLVGPLPDAGVLHRYLVAPVAVEGELLVRLVVMEHPRRFSGADMMTVRRAGTLLALHLNADRRAIEADRDAGAGLTAELLAGCADPALVKRRADRIGMRLDVPRVVVLIGSRTGAAAGLAQVRAALDALGDGAPGATVHATAVAEGVAALVGLDRAGEDAELLATAREVVHRVCLRLGAARDVAAALSTVRSGYDGCAEAYVEAQQALECIRRFAPGPGPDVVSAADLGAGRVFLATSDPSAARGFAEATFGTLARDPTKADLLATLRSFFENLASIRRCALCLGVHENTIRYRLARIEELTGLPVTHDPDAQLRARLSMLVLMLEGRLPAADAVARPSSRAAPPEREIALVGAG